MKIKMKYGSDHVALEIPDRSTIKIIDSKEDTKTTDQPEAESNLGMRQDMLNYLGKKEYPDDKGSNLEQLLSKSLENPISLQSFDEFFKKGDRVLFIVPDITRYAGCNKILPIIVDKMEGVGIDINNCEILFANGIHRQMNENEMTEILGGSIYNRIKSENHNAYDANSLEYWDRTTFGTPIFLNKKVKNFTKVLTISSVNFHYFAGFSGGKKCIIPGISGKETCCLNHKMALSDKIEIEPGNMTNNPISMDMDEVIEIISKEIDIFSINTIIDESKNIVKIFSGDILLAHREAANYYLNEYTFRIDGLYDAVIASASGFPRDINMIQSHKGAAHASIALRDGGTLFLFAECRDGFGHSDFFNWFRFKKEDDFRLELEKNYNIYGQTALSIFKKAQKYQFHLYSNLENKAIKEMGLVPAKDFIKTINKILSENDRVLFINNSGMMLPSIKARLQI